MGVIHRFLTRHHTMSKSMDDMLFELIDVDGSGAIEEKEIMAMIYVLFKGCENLEEEEACMFFAKAVMQLGNHIEGDKCTRAEWDRFHPDFNEEDMPKMLKFKEIVEMCWDHKSQMQEMLGKATGSEDLES